jgi:hypothetical protein
MIRVRSPIQVTYLFNFVVRIQLIYNVTGNIPHCILWQINLSSGYPDKRSWKNVGTINTHKKKSKEKRNEIQSPEKDLLLITSWFPFSVPSTSKVHPMGRDRDRHRISAKRTLARRKRRPRNVNLGICYVPSTSQTSQSDVFGTSLERQCAIWDVGQDLTAITMSLSMDGQYTDWRARWRIFVAPWCIWRSRRRTSWRKETGMTTRGPTRMRSPSI